MKFIQVCKVHIQRRGGNAGIFWSVAPIDPTCSLPPLPDGEPLYVAVDEDAAPAMGDPRKIGVAIDTVQVVTPAMVGAAHDVTMKEAGIILSHDLITKIYEAMSALAEAEQPKVKPKRTVTYVCPVCADSLGRQE